jgi:hypothetical protein
VDTALLPAGRAHRIDQVRAIQAGRLTPLVTTMRAATDTLVSDATASAAAAHTDATAGYRSARVTVIGLLLGALVLGVAAAVGVAAWITGPIGHVSGVLGREGHVQDMSLRRCCYR